MKKYNTTDYTKHIPKIKQEVIRIIDSTTNHVGGSAKGLEKVAIVGLSKGMMKRYQEYRSKVSDAFTKIQHVLYTSDLDKIKAKAKAGLDQSQRQYVHEVEVYESNKEEVKSLISNMVKAIDEALKAIEFLLKDKGPRSSVPWRRNDFLSAVRNYKEIDSLYSPPKKIDGYALLEELHSTLLEKRKELLAYGYRFKVVSTKTINERIVDAQREAEKKRKEQIKELRERLAQNVAMLDNPNLSNSDRSIIERDIKEVEHEIEIISGTQVKKNDTVKSPKKGTKEETKESSFTKLKKKISDRGRKKEQSQHEEEMGQGARRI